MSEPATTEPTTTEPRAPNAAAAVAEVGTSNNVYIRSEEYAWIPARVVDIVDHDIANVSLPLYKDEQLIQSDGGKKAIKFDRLAVKLTDYANKALPLQNVDENGMLNEVEDMVDLPFLHEAAILYNLKARHMRGKPYTRTGDIVIAVNPYQWMTELYNEERRTLYAEKLVWEMITEGDPRTLVEPHVYETSSLSYRGLALDGIDQSILVSGESGAGKTETVKILMNHIASVQARERTSDNDNNPQVSIIVQRVLDSNPLLEAFGNAKTSRNDNSSRFGKYLQLQFDAEPQNAYTGNKIPSCILAGSKCEVYLLEKSRVVSHEEEERSFHIFYQLLAAEDDVKEAIWDGLVGTDMESFTYVGWTETNTIEGLSDGERFALTQKALGLVGVTEESLRTLLRAICIVLQLGNLTFAPHPGDEEQSVISSIDELTTLSGLMGVDNESILKAVTQRTVRARNEDFKVPLKADKAKESCDALAKEIYAKTFLWLVRTINDATSAEQNYVAGSNMSSSFGVIGLLDIFGFESFETNRFEQLCINYANEKLQQKFTQDIFRSVQAEYEFEGIELGEIMYEDNADVLNLVEGRMGLIAVLNEECVRPKGNDVAFVSKVQAMNRDSDCLMSEKHFHDYEFGVKHYAGPVVYDATNFVSKNNDALPSDLLECAKKSSNAIVANELENEAMMNEVKGAIKKQPKNPRAAPRKMASSRLVQQTVWTKFRTQLSSLMGSLGETRTRYIRCIKPNTLKEPRIMQHLSTVEQLRCAGVVAAVTISRSAFPNRLEHEIVLDRFKSLWVKGEQHAAAHESSEESEKVRVNVERLLTMVLKSMETEKEGKVIRAFVIGKTRAYFRAGALEHLEAQRLSGLSMLAIEIQRVGRGYVEKRRFRTKRNAAIRAVAMMRRFMERQKYTRLRNACIVVQCWGRRNEASDALVKLRRNYKATVIQRVWRMVVARSILKKNVNASVILQSTVRGALQRPKFRKAMKERQEEAKLENQLKVLQKKLEDAEAARVRAEERSEEKTKEILAAKAATKEEVSAVPIVNTVAATNTFMPPAPAAVGQLTAQQQTLMDESGKMLEYLRKEVFKLRSLNSQLRTDFDLLKENNQRLMDANASAGASFAALNQHAKQLNKQNAKISAEVVKYKQQVQNLNLAQAEIKEELKMKQATYIAEVHSRLQYQKTLAKIVDVIQEKCRDSRLVEDILVMSDECENEYMSGPTGIHASPQRSIFTSTIGSPNGIVEPAETDSSMISRFKSFFG